MPNEKSKSKIAERISRMAKRAASWYSYFYNGVWSDTRSNWRIDTIRTLSLSVRSFADRDLQLRSAALTYQTALAIVPALAVVFAIGRGFGLQDMIVDELHQVFAGQQGAIDGAINYVDSYLKQSAGGGVFMGIGLVFLMWTIISLIGNVEYAFNAIWGVKQGRSLGRKVTDYTAIILILPILMVCSNGLTIFMSTAMQRMLPFSFMTPAISWMLDIASLVMTWLFFAGTYFLVPNTKVRFTNALLAGGIAGTAFVVLQWLFVTGQLYVSKYNAIYGSVAFLPLFLVWAQLAWMITLAGAVICYSSQNIIQFSFNQQIRSISHDYNRQIALAVMTVVVHRFVKGERPLAEHDFAVKYHIPVRLVGEITARMLRAGLLERVVLDDKGEHFGLQSALPPERVTIATVMQRLNAEGNADFVPEFKKNFASIISKMNNLNEAYLKEAADIHLVDLEVVRPND